MSYELSGTLYKKFDTENKSGTFAVREFVIKTSGEYPQDIKFQLVQDRCALLDTVEEGDSMNVFFDVRGREWNDKFFTTLQAWRIEAAQSTHPITSTGPDGLPF